MRWKEINEAPLADFGTSGDLDREGSFRQGDLRAIKNPKWVEKVHNAFSKTPYDFNIYLHNAEDGVLQFDGKFHIAREEYGKFHGLAPMSSISKVVGFTPPKWDQSITVLLTTNEGDERLPLTPWILAHRVAHAILYADRSPAKMLNTDLNRFIEELRVDFQKLMDDARIPLEMIAGEQGVQREDGFGIKAIAKLLGKFRSARMETVRDPGEFMIECITQFLTTGAVSFNRPEFKDQPPSEPEQPNPLLDKARAFYEKNRYGLPQDFAKSVIRSVSQPRSGYLAFDSDDMAVAAFGAIEMEPAALEAKIKQYQDRGLRVEYKGATKTAQTKYANYLAKLEELQKQYDEWLNDGQILRGLRTNRTDTLHAIIDRQEERINSATRRIMVRCIGRALVL